MNKEKLKKLIDGIVEVRKALDTSIDDVEARLVEKGIHSDLKDTIKIMQVLEKFDKLHKDKIMTIYNASRANKLLQIIGEEGEMFRIEGKKRGGTEWELIFRTRDLVVADTAAAKYRDKYAATRVMKETPEGPKPIKGREEEY